METHEYFVFNNDYAMLLFDFSFKGPKIELVKDAFEYLNEESGQEFAVFQKGELGAPIRHFTIGKVKIDGWRVVARMWPEVDVFEYFDKPEFI